MLWWLILDPDVTLLKCRGPWDLKFWFQQLQRSRGEVGASVLGWVKAAVKHFITSSAH